MTHRLTSDDNVRDNGSRRSTIIAQHFDNVSCQVIFDFTVPRYWLRNTGTRIAIPIMLGTVANQHASKSFDRLDQVDSLHGSTNSSTLRIPGIEPLVMS
jgi:hypothetical protein